FVHHTGRHSRGVKQAGFLVLYRTTMPAVLVETGFLTHQEEEQFMRSEQGQNKLSLSIAEAIEQYHHQNNP
ncbi:MAG: N-acetylmuramoyl-L-alanine amidase, partial [Bacteroidota bacterium]